MSAESSRRPRMRAAYLRPEAVERFRAALVAKWQAEASEARFTRELKGELLRLSPPTVDKMLRGEKVDRATLEVAFGRVGLDLSPADYSFEPMSEPSIPMRTHEDVEAAPSAVKPVHPRQRWRFFLGASGAFVCLLVLFSTVRQTPKLPPNYGLDSVVLNTLDKGTKAYHAARFDEARVHANEALRIARKLESGTNVAQVLLLSANIYAAEGEFGKAWTDYDEALRFRIRLNQTDAYPPIYLAKGILERRMKRNADSQRSLDLAFRLSTTAAEKAYAQGELGQLYSDQREWKSAREAYRSSLEFLKRASDPDAVVDIRGRDALVLLKGFGKVGPARSELEACLAHWQKKGHPRWTARLQLHLGQLESEAGHPELARRLLEQSRTGFEGVGDRDGVREAAQSLLVARR